MTFCLQYFKRRQKWLIIPLHYTKIIKGSLAPELIALDILTLEHKNILRKCFDIYSQNCSWDIFNNEMQNPENMRILGCEFFNGKYWWREKITDLPIYKILEDMSFALSIRQGLMDHGDTSYMEQNEKTLKEFLQ